MAMGLASRDVIRSSGLALGLEQIRRIKPAQTDLGKRDPPDFSLGNGGFEQLIAGQCIVAAGLLHAAFLRLFNHGVEYRSVIVALIHLLAPLKSCAVSRCTLCACLRPATN